MTEKTLTFTASDNLLIELYHTLRMLKFSVFLKRRINPLSLCKKVLVESKQNLPKTEQIITEMCFNAGLLTFKIQTFFGSVGIVDARFLAT